MIKYFTREEVASMFDVCVGTVYGWEKSGKMEGVTNVASNDESDRGRMYHTVDQLETFIHENPRYRRVLTKLHPPVNYPEKRRVEINECFNQLQIMKREANYLVGSMNKLIDHLNKLLTLEREEFE